MRMEMFTYKERSVLKKNKAVITDFWLTAYALNSNHFI